MNFKLFITTLFLTLTTLTHASVNPNSFTGSFKTGTCTLSNANSAVISLDHEKLTIRFSDNITPSLEIYLVSPEEHALRVSQTSYSITNELFNGKIRIARSATGDRVRVNTHTYETDTKAECVFYRTSH